MRTFFLILLLVFTTLALQACASNNDNAPVQAVENYLNALVEKDANRLTTLSCGEWEDDALPGTGFVSGSQRAARRAGL